jgi:hypothetical protein
MPILVVKLATNSSPQLGHLRAFFAMVRTGKAKQATRFSFLTTQLTRCSSAVRARTGKQPVISSNRVCIRDQGIEVEESSGEDGGSSGGTWLGDWWRIELDRGVRGFLDLAHNAQAGIIRRA